jgi:hypothetical protein
VTARATVKDVFIDGFGGPPAVDYRYTVNGRTYMGWGDGGELGNDDVFDRRPGDSVTIRYSSTEPALSCTCEPSEGYAFPSVLAALSATPFLVMVVRTYRGGRRPPAALETPG